MVNAQDAPTPTPSSASPPTTPSPPSALKAIPAPSTLPLVPSAQAAPVGHVHPIVKSVTLWGPITATPTNASQDLSRFQGPRIARCAWEPALRVLAVILTYVHRALLGSS